jgi:hypothetical protein
MSTRLVVAIAIFALMGLAECAGEGNESIAMSEPSPEALATRYLQSIYVGGPELEDVVLLPGKLPDEMPIELPIPNGSTIVGSVIIGDEEISVVVDSSLKPDEVMKFYRNTLATQNWTEMDITGMGRGFVGGSEATSFCQGKRDPWLAVTAYPLNNGTDLRLYICTDTEYYPCADSNFTDQLEPIPKLAAPRNASISNQNSLGGWGNQVALSANVETELSSADLAAHYADQLTAANWTALEMGECGQSVWSTWRFTDEDGLIWDGFLIALDLPESEDKRFVMMQTAMEES